MLCAYLVVAIAVASALGQTVNCGPSYNPLASVSAPVFEGPSTSLVADANGALFTLRGSVVAGNAAVLKLTGDASSGWKVQRTFLCQHGLASSFIVTPTGFVAVVCYEKTPHLYYLQMFDATTGNPAAVFSYPSGRELDAVYSHRNGNEVYAVSGIPHFASWMNATVDVIDSNRFAKPVIKRTVTVYGEGYPFFSDTQLYAGWVAGTNATFSQQDLTNGKLLWVKSVKWPTSCSTSCPLRITAPYSASTVLITRDNFLMAVKQYDGTPVWQSRGCTDFLTTVGQIDSGFQICNGLLLDVAIYTRSVMWSNAQFPNANPRSLAIDGCANVYGQSGTTAEDFELFGVSAVGFTMWRLRPSVNQLPGEGFQPAFYMGSMHYASSVTANSTTWTTIVSVQ